MNVYIGGAKDYSAMRGPCPEGFHIPNKDEWVNLIHAGMNAGAWTGTGGDDLKTYLKLPYNGCRLQSDGSVQLQGSYGYYWGSTAADSIAKGFRIYVGSGLLALGRNRRASGYGIRPFKDTPVVPDSGWTALYSDKIYHNSTLGLISIKDGDNWITIADKNLGAVNVNDYGNYYQRGNNYGFANSGTITTNSTQVNASSYGPGNYYSSSTFITAGNADWSSVQNDNLRGGVTGVSPAELKNAYIGEVWTPGANTLLYLPLEKDATDYSGKGRTTSPSNITYSTLGGVACAVGNGTSSKISVTPTDIVVGSTEGTVSMLVYYTGNISEYRMAMNFNRYGSYGLGIGLNSSKWTIWTNSNSQSFAVPSPLSTNNWYHVLYTVDNNGSIAYINGTQVASGTKTTGSVRGDGSTDSNGNQMLFCSRGGNNNYWKGGIREVIIEKRKRSAEDVFNYYSMIKQKLGL